MGDVFGELKELVMDMVSTLNDVGDTVTEGLAAVHVPETVPQTQYPLYVPVQLVPLAKIT